MIRLSAFLVYLCALLMPGSSAWASDLPATGDRITGVLPLMGKSIPVPDGAWVVAGAGYGSLVAPGPDRFGTTASVMLVRPDRQADRSFLLVNTNTLPVRNGWGASSACAGNLFSQVAEPRDLHESCSFVSFARGPRGVAAALPALPTGIEAALPNWALIAGLRVSDRRDMIDMRLGITPLDPAPAGWNAVELDQAHSAALGRLTEWTQAARRTVMLAMRAPVKASTALPMPVMVASARHDGRSDDENSVLVRSLYRLASYRVLNTAVGFVLATYVTGSVVTGTWVQTLNMVTHSGVFMANELAWETAATSPVIDLAGPIVTPTATQPAKAPASPPLPSIAGKQIPLPPGAWRELAREDSPQQSAIALGQVEDGLLTHLAIARVNVEQTANIVGPPGDCARDDLPVVYAAYDTPRDGFCAYAKRVTVTTQGHGDSLWAAVLERLEVEKIAPPSTYLEAAARARTRENFLDLRYYVAEPAGQTPPQGQPDPRLDAIVVWAALLQGPAELAVRGRLPSSLGLLPTITSGEAAREALIRQAKEPVDRLRDVGAINAETHTKYAEIAERTALQPEVQGWSLWYRSLAKVTTYRIGAYLDTVATTVVVTGNLGQSFTLANMHAVIKPVIALANEIGWVGGGVGSPRAALLTSSFPDIGKEIR